MIVLILILITTLVVDIMIYNKPLINLIYNKIKLKLNMSITNTEIVDNQNNQVEELFAPEVNTIEELKAYRYTTLLKDIQDQAKQYITDKYLDVSMYPELIELHQAELPDNTLKFKLYFEEECTYMKSTLWNTRQNKNLTITTNKSEADFIITPNWSISNGVDSVRMVLIDNNLSFTKSHKLNEIKYYDLPSYNKEKVNELINWISEEKKKNVKYNPLILQENDLHIVFYKYLTLNIIDDELISTVKTIFSSDNVNLKMIKNIIETSDWVKSSLKKRKELLELIHLYLNYEKGDMTRHKYKILSHPIRKVVGLMYNSIIQAKVEVKIYQDNISEMNELVVFKSLFDVEHTYSFKNCISHTKYNVPKNLITNDSVLQPKLDGLKSRITDLDIPMTVTDVLAVICDVEQEELNVE